MRRVQVRQSFETSLANLGTDYVDSLLLHSPLRSHKESMQGERRPCLLRMTACVRLWLRLPRARMAAPAVCMNRPLPGTACLPLNTWTRQHTARLRTNQRITAAPVWRAFEQLVADGAVRHIGLSNCYDEAAFAAICADADVAPSVLQNRCAQAVQALSSVCAVAARVR